MIAALTASIVVLWIAVGVLAIVVVALARQVGVLHERVMPAGALLMAGGVRPGEAAPEHLLKDIRGRDVQIGARRDDGRHTLLLFLAPSCPVCKSLLPTLRSARRSEADWLDIVLASDGELQEQLRFVEKEALQSFPYVVSRSLGVSYRAGKLPYAYLIDDEGILRTGGLVNSREHLESLFNAKELSVASVQDFLRRGQTTEKHVA
ncbi:MAG TPA: redoxin domain-containing protein [Woeseiaceae bacterium]|jgi:methylamine dehydrogenase accessory protein MauD|nr:redoxin domain-containing protein [Woeseiaceae bacterium]